MGRTIIITAPTALETALQKAETSIVGLPYERAHVFDSRGKTLLVKDGEKNLVRFEAKELPLMKNSIFTHNHPTIGGSFSIEDIMLAAKRDVAEMRAVGSKYTHRMIRPEAGWPEVGLIENEYRITDREVRAEFTRNIALGRMTADEANLHHHNEVWVVVARKLGMNYLREVR